MDDLCQRTDALSGQDARALIRAMIVQVPAVREWLGDYEFPAGTTFHPMQSKNKQHQHRDAVATAPSARAAAGGLGFGQATRPPTVNRRGSAAGSTQLSMLRQQLKSLSYGSGGQDPHKLFTMYDRDNSGLLDVKEFSNAVRKGGRVTERQMSDADLTALFRAADTDGNGQVDIEELTTFVWSDGELALGDSLSHVAVRRAAPGGSPPRSPRSLQPVAPSPDRTTSPPTLDSPNLRASHTVNGSQYQLSLSPSPNRGQPQSPMMPSGGVGSPAAGALRGLQTPPSQQQRPPPQQQHPAADAVVGPAPTAGAAMGAGGFGGSTLTKTEMELVLRRLRRIVAEVSAECERRSLPQQPDGGDRYDYEESDHKTLLVRTLYECDAFQGTEVGRQLEAGGGAGVDVLRQYGEKRGWYARRAAGGTAEG